MTQLNEVSDEMLMALADGELNESDAQRLHNAIATNPQIAARFADFVNTRQLLQAAYPTTAMPDQLIATVMTPRNVVPLRTPVARQAGWAVALAASLVLALGSFWAGRNTGQATAGPVDLAQATAGLVTGEVTSLPDGSTARVLASYQTDQGLCRLIDQAETRKLLCRDTQAGTWVTTLSVATGDAAAFLTASDLGVALIDSMLDDIGAGVALDSAAERSALGL